MHQITQNDYDMIYVISCVLHNQKPDKERMKTADLKALYETSKGQSLTAMVYMALEDADVFEVANQAWIRQWKDDKDKAIRKNLLFDTERKQLLALMEAAGIWYMPLKGSVLKDYYPKYGMRQMSDNDILYDARYAKELQGIMMQRGYKVENYGNWHPDVYVKSPIYNFEMHRDLSPANKCQKDYYENVKLGLLPDEGKKYGYHFSDEDFYIYMTVHAYRHFCGGGTGLRTLVDTYVFLQKKENTLDWDYIRQELDKLEISDFEKKCRYLSSKIFAEDFINKVETLTEKEKRELDNFLYSGTYGTIEQFTRNKLKEFHPDEETVTFGVKIRYCLSRLFPGRKWCRVNVPFFDKHPYLLPLFWGYRLFWAVFFHRDRIKAEIGAVKNS